MSVLIKGMEMPTSCGYCPFKYRTMEGDECMFDVAYTTYQSRPDDCPIVPVPAHGRLIDADALCDGLVSNHPVVIHATTAPTIIPAEEGE